MLENEERRNNGHFKAGVLTISDKGSRGERVDASGPLIEELIKSIGGQVVRYRMVPDEKDQIKEELCYMCDNLGITLILTTGGTGFAKRDVTPEAILPALGHGIEILLGEAAECAQDFDKP